MLNPKDQGYKSNKNKNKRSKTMNMWKQSDRINEYQSNILKLLLLHMSDSKTKSSL